MLATVKSDLREMRSSLWFRPAAYCVLAVLAVVACATGDLYVPEALHAWLPASDVEAVKTLLGLLAGSMMTVTTVTLSVLMLVLSLVAGQASPRAVPELMADSVTQNVLATFIASFVFALAALLLMGFGFVSELEARLVFIGSVVVSILAVRYLVQWVHHIAETLKLNQIIARVHDQALAVLEAYLPPPDADPADAAPAGDATERADGDVLPAAATGYVRYIDREALGELAGRHGLHVRLMTREGDFLHPRLPVMTVWGLAGVDDDVAAALQASVVVGPERSSAGDPLLGIELLVEIACRALSPGINDAKTALTCVDYLGSLLGRAVAVPPDRYPPPLSAEGRLRWEPPTFEAMLERAFRPIIRDGAGVAEVVNAILGRLEDLARTAAPGHLAAIAEEGGRALDYGLLELPLERDRREVQRVAARLSATVAARTA